MPIHRGQIVYPARVITGEPGEVWRNDTDKVLYQLKVTFHNSCAICIQYANAIGPYWPIPLHFSCNCKNRPIPPGGDADPFLDFVKETLRLPLEQQRRVMGAGNWLLVQKGAVAWSDVVTRSRIRPLHEVIERARLPVDRLVKLGIPEHQAREAVARVETPEKRAADATAKAAVERLKQAGLSREDIRARLASRLTRRIGISGPSGENRAGGRTPEPPPPPPPAPKPKPKPKSSPTPKPKAPPKPKPAPTDSPEIARRRARVAASVKPLKRALELTEEIEQKAADEYNRIRKDPASTFDARLAALKEWTAAERALEIAHERHDRLAEWEGLVQDNPRLIPAFPMADRLAEYTEGDRKLAALRAIATEAQDVSEALSKSRTKLDAAEFRLRSRGKRASDKDREAATAAQEAYEEARGRYLESRRTQADRTQDVFRAVDPMPLTTREVTTTRQNGDRLIPPSPACLGKIDAALSWYGQTLERAGSQSPLDFGISEFARGDGRAYAYDQGDGLVLSPKGPSRTAVHEIAHILEYKLQLGSTTLQKTVRAFLDHRVGDEPLRKLQQVFPGGSYDDDEVGREDDFGKAFGSAKWYVGKHYSDGATEILSMGLEYFFNDPIKFAERDPEFAKFLMGVLDGSLR